MSRRLGLLSSTRRRLVRPSLGSRRWSIRCSSECRRRRRYADQRIDRGGPDCPFRRRWTAILRARRRRRVRRGRGSIRQIGRGRHKTLERASVVTSLSSSLLKLRAALLRYPSCIRTRSPRSVPIALVLDPLMCLYSYRTDSD